MKDTKEVKDVKEVLQLVVNKPCENCGRRKSWEFTHQNGLYKAICFCGCVRLFDIEAAQKYAILQKGPQSVGPP